MGGADDIRGKAASFGGVLEPGLRVRPFFLSAFIPPQVLTALSLANATLGHPCTLDTTSYLDITPSGLPINITVIRDSCVRPCCWCDAAQDGGACVRTKTLGDACQRDGECESVGPLAFHTLSEISSRRVCGSRTNAATPAFARNLQERRSQSRRGIMH